MTHHNAMSYNAIGILTLLREVIASRIKNVYALQLKLWEKKREPKKRNSSTQLLIPPLREP